jgi:hypothetical protein
MFIFYSPGLIIKMKKLFVLFILLVLASGCTAPGVQDLDTRETGTLPNGSQEEFVYPNTTPKEEYHILPAKDGPPVLYDIGIDLEPYDPETGYAGDVYFEDLGYDDKMFLWFGMDYGDGSLNPHPMFVLPLGTEIHAVSEGIVNWVKPLDDNDYDVCIYRYEDDPWCVSYEHVSSPMVREGDTVRVGDVIGEAGRINEFVEFGKFDLKVWKGGTTVLNYCPYELLDDSVKEEKQAEITRFIRDWEDFLGKDVYPEEDWLSPGCAEETLEE